MNKKAILTSAVTGAGDTAKKSPYVPVTPEEIAKSAIESAKAGATIAHIHVRDPKTGGISHDPHYFVKWLNEFVNPTLMSLLI